MIEPKKKRILKLAVQAGKIMMKSGAEIYRVEDTITRICKACNMPNVEVFATPTGIFVSIDSGEDHSDVLTYVSRLRGAATDLKKISDINAFSRRFTTTDLSIEAGLAELAKIEQQKPFPYGVRLLGAALVSSFFSAIFSASVIAAVCAFGIGLVSYVIAAFLERYDINYFIKGFCCCASATVLALSCGALGLTHNYSAIIIGTMMLFVPGAAITNSIRDLLSGDMLSGMARMTEAFVVAVSLAAGAGIIIKLWSIIGLNDVPATVYSPDLLVVFILGFVPTFGFALLFHVPKENLLPAALIGGIGWLAYQTFALCGSQTVLACFWGACVVGMLSEFGARTLKQASTVFAIPGIIPLVPGAGTYYTMLKVITGDYAAAASTGTQTLFMAGAIALGLLVTGSIV
ncbi:MAG: threonine/serine exporter family protein, partial [Anaerovoracaceae bacterium]